MRNTFAASICAGGVHGGALRLESGGARFCCKKLTIEAQYRDLFMAYAQIAKLRAYRKAVLFPMVAITMKDASVYRFVIFRRGAFLREVYRRKQR